jgi:hypothetical protein
MEKIWIRCPGWKKKVGGWDQKHPRSQIRLFSIPDTGSEFFHPGSASKNLDILPYKMSKLLEI